MQLDGGFHARARGLAMPDGMGVADAELLNLLAGSGPPVKTFSIGLVHASVFRNDTDDGFAPLLRVSLSERCA